MNIYSLNFKKNFLKNIFVKWCASVESVQVFVFTKEFYVHFWYVSTLMRWDGNSKKVKKKVKNEENTLLWEIKIS